MSDARSDDPYASGEIEVLDEGGVAGIVEFERLRRIERIALRVARLPIESCACAQPLLAPVGSEDYGLHRVGCPLVELRVALGLDARGAPASIPPAHHDDSLLDLAREDLDEREDAS